MNGPRLTKGRAVAVALVLAVVVLVTDALTLALADGEAVSLVDGVREGVAVGLGVVDGLGRQ